MRTNKLASMLIMLFIVLMLAGCSSPSSGTVEEAILKKVGTVKEVKNIDILNKYSRDVNGEEVWTIEFEIEVVYTDGTARTIGKSVDKFKDKVKIVKRGNTWYRVG